MLNLLGNWLIICFLEVLFYFIPDIIIPFGIKGEIQLKWMTLFSHDIVDNKEGLISKIVLNKERVFWVFGEPAFKKEHSSFLIKEFLLTERTSLIHTLTFLVNIHKCLPMLL